MMDWLKPWLDYSLTLGSFKIAPADIAIAFAAFFGLRVITTLWQRLLLTKILPRTHFDSGLKDSILTFTDYIGSVIAILVALSVLGINLSSIALIAGALSVGIGFGLQNIVNNFVSGIILLIERPIKVGDWVVIGPNEGFVQKIRVRSTEIETFQKASVIIPNSDLLQHAVRNWTHHNTRARIDIVVELDANTNAVTAESLLLEIAHAHQKVLDEPHPFVVLKDISGKLVFELRVYVDQVTDGGMVASDIRKALLPRLKAADIHFPISSMDVHYTPKT